MEKEAETEEPEKVDTAEEKKGEESEAAMEEAEVVAEPEEPQTVEAAAEEEAAEELEEAEEPEEAEEEKIERPEREEVEEEIVKEAIYNIPLSRAWISPRRKRAPRAMRLIRSFVERHMKMRGGSSEGALEEERRLVISNDVNEKVWSRGIQKPPRKIRVRVTENTEGTVTVHLAEGD